MTELFVSFLVCLVWIGKVDIKEQRKKPSRDRILLRRRILLSFRLPDSYSFRQSAEIFGD
jgi:hypothetical protein